MLAASVGKACALLYAGGFFVYVVILFNVDQNRFNSSRCRRWLICGASALVRIFLHGSSMA